MKVELTTVLYLVDRLNIANWNKLKKQLAIKYGNEFMDEWMEKVEAKKKNVEPKILEFVDYKVCPGLWFHGVAQGEDRPRQVQGVRGRLEAEAEEGGGGLGH